MPAEKGSSNRISRRDPIIFSLMRISGTFLSGIVYALLFDPPISANQPFCSSRTFWALP
jgi:hypothetical protein